MKTKVLLEKILKPIIIAERVSGKNLSLPVLENIILEFKNDKIIISATNLEIGIEAVIPAKTENLENSSEKIAINGKVFLGILSSFRSSSEYVILKKEDNNLIIENNESQSNRSILKTHPYEEFPVIPVIKKDNNTVKLPSKSFIEGVKSVWYSSSFSDIKPELSSIYIYPNNNELCFVATDSFRLAEKKIKIKETIEFEGLIIPSKNIIEISKIFESIGGDMEITFNKNQAGFYGDGIYTTTRIIDGIFPDYKQIIPKEKNTEIIVLKEEFHNAIKLANIFSDKFNQVDMIVKPKDKIFEIKSISQDIGQNTTKINASLSGEDIEVSFNHKYIIDCFQSINQDSLSLEFSKVGKPLVIKGVSDKTFTYLVMPMNR